MTFRAAVERSGKGREVEIKRDGHGFPLNEAQERKHRLARSAFLVNTLLLALPIARGYAQGIPGPIEPRAGSWKTHVLAAGSELRLAAPPPGAAPPDSGSRLSSLLSRARRRPQRCPSQLRRTR